MKKLTIITTTYNRKNRIMKLYESLVEQSNKDFIWLVIDDGSTDNTEELIKRYIEDGTIEIEYHYKENGGMHTARNMGYKLAHTELNTIIDSDDWLAPNAVDTIISFWEKNKEERYAGFIALNADPDGKIIGTNLPKSVTSCSYIDFWKKYHMEGDKKLVYRSELTKQYPFPEYEGETFYPASYKYYMIDRDYDLLLLDKVICIVDYNEDSMTRNKFSQYKSCSNSFMDYRKKMIEYNLGIKENIKHMIHYVMESRFAKRRLEKEILTNPLICITYVPGIILYYYIKNTNRKY